MLTVSEANAILAAVNPSATVEVFCKAITDTSGIETKPEDLTIELCEEGMRITCSALDSCEEGAKALALGLTPSLVIKLPLKKA